MIQEIKIKNCLSFKDEAVFSFEATRDTTLEDSLIVEVAPGVRLLRFAMIMGANGSGKSNLLHIIDFFRIFWDRKPEDVNDHTTACPFLLEEETKDQPCEAEVKFWIDGIKYWYIVKLDRHTVYEESLYIYKSVQPTNVFMRTLEDGLTHITFNPAVTKVSEAALDKIQVECLNNMSVFVARKNVNAKFPVFDDVHRWTDSGILPIIDPETHLFSYAKNRIHMSKELHDYMLEYLKCADFNIDDLRTTKENRKVSDQLIKMLTMDDEIPGDERERLLKEKTMPSIEIQFVHYIKKDGEIREVSFDEYFQSYGTRRTMGIETAIFEALHDGSLLNVDEYDTSMHPDIIEYSIKRFLSTPSQSQMVISTHYDPLLSTIDELIRKDCVWFTEKKEDGSSRLYSLVEFKGLNRMASIRNNYRRGVFGALPKIDCGCNKEEEKL